jgi:hypothetical protein
MGGGNGYQASHGTAGVRKGTALKGRAWSIATAITHGMSFTKRMERTVQFTIILQRVVLEPVPKLIPYYTHQRTKG